VCSLVVWLRSSDIHLTVVCCHVLSCPELGVCCVCEVCVSVCLFVCFLLVLGHLFPFFSSINEMIRSSFACLRKKSQGS
jgi:hypothetical protein